MFERFSERARRTLFFARYEASQLGDHSIAAEHLLLGIARDAPPGVVALLRFDKEARDALRTRVIDAHVPSMPVSTSIEIPFSEDARRVLAAAALEADLLGHTRVGADHLFLGILRESSTATAALGRDDLTLYDARLFLAQHLAKGYFD